MLSNQFLPLLGGSNSQHHQHVTSTSHSRRVATAVVVPLKRLHRRRLIPFLVAVVLLVLILQFVNSPALRNVHQVDQFVRDIFTRAERRGAIPRFPSAFREDGIYTDFPELQMLQDNYLVIRNEAMALLQQKENHIPRLRDMVQAERAKGNVYKADWKVFWFRMGLDIKENGARAPQTAALLQQIPNLHNAFFSVLAPNTHIDPHWGHYKGFLRYHLGLIVPQNNTNHNVFLRIRPDVEKNRDMTLAEREVALAEGGAATYYWKEGVGVMFDDNPLHDASNLSNETRVVLFLDVARRPMTWYMNIFNSICIFIVNRVDPIASMRKLAVVDESRTLSVPGQRRRRLNGGLLHRGAQRHGNNELSMDTFLQ